MFNKVMWATDGSEAADEARSFARALAVEGGGEMLVAHCEELTMPGKGGSFPVHANEDELKAKIEHQVAELSGDGVATTLQLTRARVGGAAHAIADTARESGAEVIVVGAGTYRAGGPAARQRHPTAAAHRPVPGAGGPDRRTQRRLVTR